MKKTLLKIKGWLASLSFKTGVVVLAMCIPFYVASFAQMALPISAQAQTALWVTLFGLAKTFQYAGLTILGVEGYRRVKAWFKRDSDKNCDLLTNSRGRDSK